MSLSAKQEELVVNESLKLIIDACEKEGINYFELDKKTQDLCVVMFQTGAGAVESIARRLNDEK